MALSKLIKAGAKKIAKATEGTASLLKAHVNLRNVKSKKLKAHVKTQLLVVAYVLHVK